MATRAQVPAGIVARLEAICLGLPEATQEPAWTGMRWLVGRKTFAHVVRIEHGWPPAYARAAGTAGPATVLTFRLPIARRASPRHACAPFFKPPWFADIVGMAIDAHTDWDEVADLLVRSYCVLAPKKWAARVERPVD